MPRTSSSQAANAFVKSLEQYLEKREFASQLQVEFAQNPSCTNSDDVLPKLRHLYELQGLSNVPNLVGQAQAIAQIPNIDVRLREGNVQLVEDIACVMSVTPTSLKIDIPTVQAALQFCHLHAPDYFPVWDEISDWFIRAYLKPQKCFIGKRVGQIVNDINLIIDVYNAVREALNLPENVSYNTIKDKMYDILLTIGIKLTEPAVLQHIAEASTSSIDGIAAELLQELLPELAIDLGLSPNFWLKLVLLLIKYFRRYIVNRYGAELNEKLQELRKKLRAHSPPTIDDENA